MGYNERRYDKPQRRLPPAPKGMSFTKFSRYCKFHMMTKGIDGYKAICTETKRTCNMVSCPRWRQ